MNKIQILLLIIFMGSFYSCEKYLDETPDNRTEIDSRQKIRKLLISAYPANEYITIAELSSDNIMDYGESNPDTRRFFNEVALWQDVSENTNESPQQLWTSCYKAIANANLVLQKIDELKTNDLKGEKGEALIARAFSHFILVNIFSKHYNPKTSNTDLGIPYMDKPETTLNPKYERGNVAEVYKKIEKDILAALPLIKDNLFEVQAYHFNRNSAFAFAARFYLYYGKWAKAKEYATKVLTKQPEAMLRDWAAMGLLPNRVEPKTNAFINNPASLFLFTATSGVGAVFGPYGVSARYNHLNAIAKGETFFAPMPWSYPLPVKSYDYRNDLWSNSSANFDKVLMMKVPFLFEETDAVQGIGYRKTIVVPFTTDELLLIRAEAEALLGETELALADLNIWSKNFYKEKETTMEKINEMFDNIPYDSPDRFTLKKKLSPKFTMSGNVNENLIHYILQCRRILTIHEGLRWFDVKRYGIQIYRKQQNENQLAVVDVLKVDDNRKAIQIPKDVLSAGLQANPR